MWYNHTHTCFPVSLSTTIYLHPITMSFFGSGMRYYGAGEMVQWLEALTALLEGIGSILNTQVGI